MKYRNIDPSEYDLLRDFLYEAIYIPEGVDPPARSIIENPELALYYKDFGSGSADRCIVAEDDGTIVGAAWTRIMDDYGHVDDDTPSLAISVFSEYRGKGIGTKLLKTLISQMKEQGYTKVSLSVQKENRAVHLYERAGFRTIGENSSEYIMIYDLNGTGQESASRLSHPFGPLYSEHSRVLILGSFPSVKSREQNFFYGHPQNRFWRVIAAIYDSPVPETIAEKKDLIISSDLALWDSIASCEIKGSSDSSIRNVKANDLSIILDNCDIEQIYCNGRKSYDLYEQYIEPKTGKRAICLPSTSPANAQWSLDRLIEAWSVIKGIVPHGTSEIRTDNMVLRRYRIEDAEQLYKYLGTDPAMYKYSGWNPYETLEMAEETVQKFIDSYDDGHVYSWVMGIDDAVVGTIGAYDLNEDSIEVGFSVVKDWQGRGLATEALATVLKYLTENEGISCVTAWCAAENAGSKKVLEKSGMKLVNKEKGGLTVGDKTYDRLDYEYRAVH